MAKRASKEVIHGEDALPDIESVDIKLANGRTVTFEVHRELHVPTDPDKIVEASSKSPARYAFWAAQAERALAHVRRLEFRFAQAEAVVDLRVRESYRQGLMKDTEDWYTERKVTSIVVKEPEVKSAQTKLNEAKYRYGVLRSIRNAVEHRGFVLRTLVAQSGDYKSG